MTIARNCRVSNPAALYPPSRASNQMTSHHRLMAATTALRISRRTFSAILSTTRPAMIFLRCRRVSSRRMATIYRLNGMVKTEGHLWLVRRQCPRLDHQNEVSLASSTRSCKASSETSSTQMRRRPKMCPSSQTKEVAIHLTPHKSLRPLVLVVRRHRVHVLQIPAVK